MFYMASSAPHLWQYGNRVTQAAASGIVGVDVSALGMIHHQPMLCLEYSRINLLEKISAGNFFLFSQEKNH